MESVTSKRQNGHKIDLYEENQINKVYGSDSSLGKIKEKSANIDSYIDFYPDFKIWAKTDYTGDKLENLTSNLEELKK